MTDRPFNICECVPYGIGVISGGVGYPEDSATAVGEIDLEDDVLASAGHGHHELRPALGNLLEEVTMVFLHDPWAWA